MTKYPELLIQMYLREVEDKISLWVPAWDYIKPQLPHEEHKIGYVHWSTCTIHTNTHIQRFLSKYRQA